MKKKLLGSVLAVAVLAVSSLSAFAAISKTANVTPVGENAANYTISQLEDKETEMAAVDSEVAQLVQQANDDEITTDEVIQGILDMVTASQPDEAETFQQELTGKRWLTKFLYAETVGDVERSEDGTYVMTLSVPTLTEEATNVRVLYYNTVTKQWEIAVPTNVDYENKEITVAFTDLPAIFAVVADVDETADVAEGTSPKTGVTSDWGLYMAGAVVLFGAAGVVYSRKRA